MKNKHSRTWIQPALALLTMTWLLLSAGGRAAGDWPTYRGDITHSGVTTDSVEGSVHPQWTFKALAAPKPAWPLPAEELPRMHGDNAFHAVIADGVVYFGSSVTDRVLAIDAQSGVIRWTFFAEAPVRFAPTVVDGHVYFGSDDGYAYCLDARDGTITWKYRAGPANEKVLGNGRMISLWPVRTNVLVDDGIAYFVAGVFPYEGIYVCALDAIKGIVIWRNDTIGDRAHELEFGGISPHGYLVASARTLFVPSGRAMPAAFDRSTGKFLYTAAPGGKRGGTWALLDQNRLIAGTDNSGVPGKMSYDARSGRPQGDAFAWFNGIDMVVTPKMVYVVTANGVDAVDRQAYQRALAQSKRAGGKNLKKSIYAWRYPAKGLMSVIRTGNLVIAGGDEKVIGLDVATGKQAWSLDVHGRAVGLAAAQGRVVVSTDTGEVYCFAAGAASSPAKTIAIAPVDQPYHDEASDALYREAAEMIVAQTDVKRGYCLVLDCGEGRLAWELAQRTDLQIIGLEADPGKLATARAKLAQASLLGQRVVVEPWTIAELPDYFANLIVSDGMLRNGQTASSKEDRLRVLRPWGGVECLGSATDGKVTLKRFVRGPLEGAGSWTQQYGNPHNTACSDDQLVNGPLGVLWFGEPGPQGMVERHARAEAPLALDGRMFIEGEDRVMAVDAFNGTLLWKREIPGAVRVKTKRDSGNLTVTKTGLYIAAQDKCYRLDPATGKTLHVYELPIDGLDGPRRWGYITVVDGLLYGSTATAMTQPYAALLKVCLERGAWKKPEEVPANFQADYQQLKKRYPNPKDLKMAAERSGLLYRKMTRFAWGGEFTQKGAVTEGLMVSDRLFAFDVDSGKLLWQYDGKKIANVAIVAGEGKIFLADAGVNDTAKAAALAERRKLIDAGIYKLRDAARDELKQNQQQLATYVKQQQQRIKQKKDHRQLDRTITQLRYVVGALEAEFYQDEMPDGKLTLAEADVREVVALDARTGKPVWQKTLDLTGCCGDAMGAAYSDGLLLFFGNFGNHDAWRFSAGGLKWRRITALHAESGRVAWSRALNYRTRPVVVGDKIILEPRACYLQTGDMVTRQHPLTGMEVPWEFLRPGHTCGISAASADGLFYRSACTAFYDLAEDRGVTLFGAYRPGCAISVIPACGMLLSAEAAAGCTCSYPVRCTVALKRKPRRAQPWTVFVTPGDLRPVKHMAVNLGAVADMKDAEGTVWFAYPNPNTSRYNHFPNYGVKFNLHETIAPNGAYFAHDFKGVTIPGTDKPWLFTSGCRGLVRCELPLIDAEAGQPPATYTVRLGLRAPNTKDAATAPVEIKLQGHTVQRDVNIAQLAGQPGKPVVLQYPSIGVKDTLVVELVVPADSETTTAPAVCFIEVVRQETE